MRKTRTSGVDVDVAVDVARLGRWLCGCIVRGTGFERGEYLVR